jgi:hypothetical protein
LKFLFAVLAPHVFCAFLELQSEEGNDVLGALALHNADNTPWEHAFWLDPQAYVFSNDEGEFSSDGPHISVLDEVVHSSGTRVVSDSDWEAWHIFKGYLPYRRPRRAHAGAAAAAPRPPRSVIAANPWLQDLLGEGGGGHAVVASPTPFVSALDDGDEHRERDFEDQDVWAALAEARARLIVDEVAPEHFAWNLRGGAWTREHVGEDFDSFRSYASSAEGRAFLSRHGLPQSATFSIRRYGEHACAVFCRQWVARMGFLMQLEAGAVKGQGDVFSDDAMSAFAEPADFSELAATAGGHVLQRILALRAVRPR